MALLQGLLGIDQQQGGLLDPMLTKLNVPEVSALPAQAPQPQKSSFLNSPGMSNALLRLGSSLLQSADAGTGTGSAIAQGLEQFGSQLALAKEKQKAEAKLKAEQEARRKYLSGEGQIADVAAYSPKDAADLFEIKKEQAKTSGGLQFEPVSKSWDRDVATANYIVANPDKYKQGDVKLAQSFLDTEASYEYKQDPLTKEWLKIPRRGFDATVTSPTAAGITQGMQPTVAGQPITQPITRQPTQFTNPALQQTEAEERLKMGLEKEGGYNKAKSALGSMKQKTENQLAIIGELKGILKEPSILPKTGFGGQILSNIGGTAAYDLAAKNLTLEANQFVNSLQEMRANSPTGGAVGNVSDAEGNKLSSLIANVDTAQSEDAYRSALDALEKGLMETNERMTRAFDEDFKGVQQQPASTGGARFIGFE